MNPKRLIFLVAALMLLPAIRAEAGHGANLPYGGVNTHLTYSDTPYHDYNLVAQRLKHSETKLYRDGINPDQGQAYYDRFSAAVRHIRSVSGARLMLTSVRADQTAAQITQVLNQMAPLVNEGHIIAIEGSNEWDNVAGSTVMGWEKQIRYHQCELHRQVKARWPNLTVVGPSLSYKTTGAFVGDLSHCMDVGNFHYYSAHGIYARDLVERWEDKAIVAGWADGVGDPIIVTEANGIYGSNWDGTTEQTQADRMRELYQALSGLSYGGAHRVFSYELLQPSRMRVPLDHSDNNYGLYRSNGSVKPVFYTVLEANRRG